MRIPRAELRLAARSFTRHPGFTTVAVLSLALAIALNTTMYSVIDALVRPKVDMTDADRLYGLRIWGDARNHVDPGTRASLLRTGFDVYESATFISSLGIANSQLAVEYKRRYQMSAGMAVAPNYFQVLGVQPIVGRVFVDADAVAESSPVIISDRLSAGLFPDGESPLSKVIDIDGAPHPVIGVIGARSQFPGQHNDIWLLPPPGTKLADIPFSVLRLKKGISPERADQQLHTLSARFAALANESPKDAWFQLIPETRPAFSFQGFHFALIGAVVAVLLIACANLANLQLARGIARSRELALRTALGASRRDIILQLVLESAILAAVGLVVGVLLTVWGVHFLSSRVPPSVGEYLIAPQTSWRVFAFAAVAAVLCVMLVGLLPALRVSRVDPNELLKSGAGTGANKRSRRQYGAMVVIEIGLSLAVLSAAAVVVRAAFVATRVKPDYDVKPLSAAWILFRVPADTTLRYSELFDGLISVAKTLPDVADAAWNGWRQVDSSAVTVMEAGGSLREIPAPMFGYTMVSPSYLRTMGRAVIRGHDFIEGPHAEPEVIVSEATAKFLWPGADPIGQRIKLGSARSYAAWVRVVGITPTQRETNNNQLVRDPESPYPSRLGAIYYLPGVHDSLHVTKARAMAFDLYVRARTDPDRMPITLKRGLRDLGPMQLISANRMEVAIGLVRERERRGFVAAMFSVFAVLAIALAALGIYGIVAHSVAERRREFGVRIALGATDRNILHVVLREGNPVALAGVALGLLLTKYTVEWLAAFSFEGDQRDAPLFAAMAAVLFGVAVVAALIPALRATRIDPVESLRCE
ncbi:MAG: FtsX-like permease family protein [Gemmatimonadaceae bacterium]